MTREHPIGVYDSGVGGLTVVHWLHEILPEERILYFGDTARVPYGSRPPEELIEFSRQILAFLKEQRVKFVIAACNTSSALALPVVASESPVPMMGVIEAGAHAAIMATRNGKVGMIGTQATVDSHAYAHALKEVDPGISVYEQACPELVPLIEAGYWEGAVVERSLEKYLAPLAQHQIDTLILGCTHYPLLFPSIQRLLGSKVAIIDPAETVVRAAEHKLKEFDLLSEGRPGEDRYFVSGDPLAFRTTAARLGYTHAVEHVDIENYAV